MVNLTRQKLFKKLIFNLKSFYREPERESLSTVITPAVAMRTADCFRELPPISTPQKKKKLGRPKKSSQPPKLARVLPKKPNLMLQLASQPPRLTKQVDSPSKDSVSSDASTIRISPSKSIAMAKISAAMMKPSAFRSSTTNGKSSTVAKSSTNGKSWANGKTSTTPNATLGLSNAEPKSALAKTILSGSHKSLAALAAEQMDSSECSGLKISSEMPGQQYECPKLDAVSSYMNSKGDQVWICLVCMEPEREESGSPMICCDNCEDWYHFNCVGITESPPENINWYCKRCIYTYLKRKAQFAKKQKNGIISSK